MNEGVTVLIPFYNPGVYIKDAVESLFRQTFTQWKLILIDDASTDCSIDHIKDFLSDNRVHLIRNTENIGQSMSLNKALREVDTEFLMLLDSDDWLQDNALETFINHAKNVPTKVALVISNVNIVTWDTENNIPKHTFAFKKKEWGYFYPNRYKLLLANLFPWQKFYRTAAVNDLGGWPVDDPCQGRYTEDLAMFLQLIEKYNYVLIDQVLYNYRLHDNNLMNNKKIVGEMVEWLIRKTLIRWGDRYDPIFINNPQGSRLLYKLIPKR